MPVIVPVSRGERDDALASAIDLCRREDRLLIALLHRPLGHFDQESIDAEVDELTDRLDSADIGFRIEVRLDEKDLAWQISDLAQDASSLVVVSLAHKPAGGKLILGSQIQKLLLECPCSVLVVREQPHEGSM